MLLRYYPSRATISKGFLFLRLLFLVLFLFKLYEFFPQCHPLSPKFYPAVYIYVMIVANKHLKELHISGRFTNNKQTTVLTNCR